MLLNFNFSKNYSKKYKKILNVLRYFLTNKFRTEKNITQWPLKEVFLFQMISVLFRCIKIVEEINFEESKN